MHDDDTLLGLEHAGRARQHRGGRPVFSSRGAIYHLNARTGSRSKGQSARAAAAYIQREAEYSRDQDRADELLYTASGHMPAWAEADPTDYWNAADLYERANGRLFKRLEFALPTALTADEQRELAVGFAHHLTADEQLPYTLAIHAGDGTNPHCHLLISERTNDGLERAPEQWFRRYNAAEPERGGARKTEALKPKAWLEATREAWAEQTNQALEEAGLEIRIDHRSLAAQGIERLPSLHLGPTVQAMEARGIETERGAEARRREQVNAQLAALTAQQEEIAYERTPSSAELERGVPGLTASDRAPDPGADGLTPGGGGAAARERELTPDLGDPGLDRGGPDHPGPDPGDRAASGAGRAAAARPGAERGAVRAAAALDAARAETGAGYGAVGAELDRSESAGVAGGGGGPGRGDDSAAGPGRSAPGVDKLGAEPAAVVDWEELLMAAEAEAREQERQVREQEQLREREQARRAREQARLEREQEQEPDEGAELEWEP